MNFLVETKNEYTIQLLNILSPHIFEGFESIYSESKKIIKKGEEKKILKAFQQFIKRVPSWNSNLIENETIRIKAASRCDFLHNLLKAVIKANIILLSNSKLEEINIEKKYLDIPLEKFIHRCYIECARQFYNAPYLFYHDIRPIERKKHQRECYDIIKQSIKEAIRKMLPVNHILDKYLGSKVEPILIEVDKPLSRTETENLKELVNYDLNIQQNDSIHLTENKSIVSDNETNNILNELKNSMVKPISEYYNENKNSIENELSIKDINTQISEIKENNFNEAINNLNSDVDSILIIDTDAQYEDVFSNNENKNDLDSKKKDLLISKFNIS
tara:strand:- start:106 stop:1098 length:993 start_codon:yes stop_codon:yes gene_type:complete